MGLLHGLADATLDKEQNAAARSLVGGLYLVLTGFWFATRSAINPRNLAGLLLMLTGILAGTWAGIALLLDPPERNPAFAANLVFLAGLLVHLTGVLYTR